MAWHARHRYECLSCVSLCNVKKSSQVLNILHVWKKLVK